MLDDIDNKFPKFINASNDPPVSKCDFFSTSEFSTLISPNSNLILISPNLIPIAHFNQKKNTTT
jgi:hypothetical protein